MAQTSINIRMDEELKKQFEQFCADVGMSMTTAFCIFAKKTVSEARIPFEISSNSPNQITLQALKEIELMKADKSFGKSYNDVDEMMEELLK